MGRLSFSNRFWETTFYQCMSVIGHPSLVGMLSMVMLMDKWVIGCVNFTVKLNRAKLFIHAATICIDQPAQHASTRDMGGQSAAQEGRKNVNREKLYSHAAALK